MAMSYRNDLEALAARHDALATEVATKTKELDAARQLLDDAQQRAKLPVLPNIRVATPCMADWNKMTGDDRVRACADCNKNVYNISELTRDEAEALIVAKEGRLCVRYYQRKDGTILLKDCVIGIAQSRKRRVIAAGAAALLAGGGFAAYRLTRQEPAPRMQMGEVSAELTSTIPDRSTQPVNAPPHAQRPHEESLDLSEVKGKLQVKMGDYIE